MSTPPKILRYLKRWREKKKAALAQLKLARGCENTLCRWSGPFIAEMLEFDHLDPATKAFKVSDTRHMPWARVLAEIAKCRVLCANCHRTVTFPS